MQGRLWYELGMIIHFLKESIVSNEDRIHPKAVIDIGIVPDLLALLHEDLAEEGKLQTQAAWLLANITAGTSEDTMHLVKSNCIPIFARSLRLKNDEVHENVSLLDIEIKTQLKRLCGLWQILPEKTISPSETPF